MNKFKYFTQGINSILEGGCKNLSQGDGFTSAIHKWLIVTGFASAGIESIAIDGDIIPGDQLPSSIESIVFSNIPAYAGTAGLFPRVPLLCTNHTSLAVQMVRIYGAVSVSSKT